MDARYPLPRFTEFGPKKIVKLVHKIDADEEIRQTSFSEERVETAIRKLSDGASLKRKDYKILLYRLEELQRRNLLIKFTDQVKEFFTTYNRLYYHLKALIYSYYRLYQDRNLFYILKLGVSNNAQWKDEMQPLRKIVEESADYNDFFKRLYREFEACSSIDEIEKKMNEFMIKKDMPVLELILFTKVVNAIEKGRLVEEHRDIMDITQNMLPTVRHKKVFEKVLISLKNSNLERLKPEEKEWFIYISERLGDPYGKGKTRWIGISDEAIDVFKRWRSLDKINHYFSEIVGDRRRLKFWKKYVNYFYRVEYFEDYDKALLMETANHTFVEFAGRGALYMYSKDSVNINHIENAAAQWIPKTRVINSILKDRSKALERLLHAGSWEDSFEYEFRYYNYYI